MAQHMAGKSGMADLAVEEGLGDLPDMDCHMGCPDLADIHNSSGLEDFAGPIADYIHPAVVCPKPGYNRNLAGRIVVGKVAAHLGRCCPTDCLTDCLHRSYGQSSGETVLV